MIIMKYDTHHFQIAKATLLLRKKLDKMPEVSEKKHAKLCYEHIGGKLGELLLQKFIANGWFVKDELNKKELCITEKGTKGFFELGIDLSQVKS
jgi:hypothetical protein